MERFFVVPHTHWDREWYAPVEHFRLELGRVVDGVLDVLELDPRFRSFTLDGQAIVLEDYVEVRPEHEPRLRALIAAGRIEVGPGYVLPDELLVGGEPLVRNLLIGHAVCERFGARPSRAGYVPDSFGHPLQLPQVLAGFGIGSLLFSRGLGDEFDELGVVFRWRAPDGSEVLAFQLLPHYDNFAALAGAEDAAHRVDEICARFGQALERAGIDAVVLCNGSDHLPIQPELPAIAAELERRSPGRRFTIARYEEYVDAIGAPTVPAFTGELLGSRLQNVLRGVNSARLYIKQANQRAEQRLIGAETLAGLVHLRRGAPFPTSEFRLAWRELLRCQPHDSICGCSCDEVHRDMLVRYASLHRTLSELEDHTLADVRLAELGRSLGVINPLPQRRRAVIEVPGCRPAEVELDGFAAGTVALEPAPPRRLRDGSAIENERFRVQAAATGALTVLDRRTGLVIDGLHRLEDEADMGDLYTFCPVEGAGVRRSGPASLRVRAENELVQELRVHVWLELPAGLCPDGRPSAERVRVTVSTVVRLVRGSDLVEFRTTIENPARDHRLRVVFPVAGATGPVRSEGQFALVRRLLTPAPPRTRWAEPPAPTQHTLGAVALGPLALLTEGLPEYEARPKRGGAELCLTLLRCVGVISQPAGVLATRPLSAGPQTPTPEGQCRGSHTVRYAVRLDADELGDVALLRAAQDFRGGLVEVAREVRFDPPLALEGDVVFSCLKGAENGDGLILRCFNPAIEPVSARVTGAVSVARTRLDETGEEPLPAGTFELGAGEIATVRLRPAR